MSSKSGLGKAAAIANTNFDGVIYYLYPLVVESGYCGCRYTSFVVRQDIDANTFVGANHNLVLPKG